MINVFSTKGLKDISSEVLLPNGYLKLLSYKEWEKYSFEELRMFCHVYARYGIVTLELVEYLKNIIGNKVAIEIGAGSGDLGFHLGIHMTDSKIQLDPIIQKKYKAMMQPTINYSKDVEKIESLEAAKKYQPQIVVASWVTTYSPFETTYGSSPCGIKEDEILKLVNTYILIGSTSSHGDKPIMKWPHKEIKEPFIVSRLKNKDENRIWIFGDFN